MKKIIIYGLVVFSLTFMIFSLSLQKISAYPYINGGVDILLDHGIRSLTSDQYYEYVVTDDDDLDEQPSIEIDFVDWGINYHNLIWNSYKTVVFIFQLDIAEIDDGYQEIYLCTPENDQIRSYTNFEHDTSGTNTYFSRYEFYVEFPYTYFGINTTYYLRFGAHGFGDDDWKFRNVKGQVLISTDTYHYSNMLYVTNAILFSLNPTI